MNITSRPVPSAKVSREIVLPETTSGSSNSGAAVPSANMVDSVAAIKHSLSRSAATQRERNYTKETNGDAANAIHPEHRAVGEAVPQSIDNAAEDDPPEHG